jgi:hypothetical protein
VAKNWSYFFEGVFLDPVAAGDQSSFIWDSTGFLTGNFVSNAQAYGGFLAYAFGINQANPPFRSGGAGDLSGFQSIGGNDLAIRRSGHVAIEVKGNYNTLGWAVDPDDDHWWMYDNLGNSVNDLYSIAQHELGHTLAFSPAYPDFDAAINGMLSDPALIAYYGSAPEVDAASHFSNVIDPVSRKGAFGNDYGGEMPVRRWMITKFDLLAAQAVGYLLMATGPFLTLNYSSTIMPEGRKFQPYATGLDYWGGIKPYYFSVDSGSLPPGLVLDSYTGALTGIPDSAGVYNFDIRLEDQDPTTPPITHSYEIIVRYPVSVEPALGSQPLRIFPNPSGDVCYVEIPEPGVSQARLRLIDLLGQQIPLLFDDSDGPDRIRLDLHALPAGLYLLTVQTQRGVYAGRLVRQSQ